jgi:small GTP-binding protein
MYTSRIKVLFVGEPAVGKTSILRKYSMNSFADQYSATISMDFYAKELDNLLLDLWDLSGHPEFFEDRQRLYQGTQVLVLVYDITSRRTFDSLDMWLNEANVFIKVKPFTVLCGNKTDLPNYRVVPKNEAEYWARSRNIEYFEVSALEGENLGSLFQSCADRFKPDF